MNNSSGVRVSIPNNVKKTIQNIKEITGNNHTDDDIYAMLKECFMDPNDTVQKLLLQDPFHEVKRKRDRKKETAVKEATEPRWKPGMQGRGNRGGRGNHSSRHISHEKVDAGSSKTSLSAKGNETNKGADNGAILPTPKDKKNIQTSMVASSSIVVSDKPVDIVAEKSSTVPPETNKISATRNISAPKTSAPVPRVDLSASDPILISSQDSRLPIGTIRREIGSQQTPVDQSKETLTETKSSSGLEVGSPLMQGKTHSEHQGDGNTLLSDSSRLIARPPSNYNTRPQQAIGPQKVGPGKEWKPKPISSISTQELGVHDSAEEPTIPIAISVEDYPSLNNDTSKNEPCIPDGQHVIIPNHLHVPETEKLGFRFGSFDATVGISSICLTEPVSDKSPLLSDDSEEIIEHIEEQPTGNQDVLVITDDGDYADRPPSSNVPENLSTEGDMSSNVAPEHIESKPDTSLPTAGHQFPLVHPNLSFGFIPPIIGSQMAPFESNESQVQQPLDPAGYYPQFIRSGVDTDGRTSPFHPSVKYNGNVPVLSSQASQSSQEVGNSIAGPTTLAMQAGGVMQSSIAVTQQPLPVFRQPTGLHLPHYPPNYIPYGPYFSPFYIPPPAIHQFLGNGSFPQQPQGGNMYPAQPVATQKYPLPQYKPGNNTVSSGHIGVPGTYGPYGLNPSVYNPNPAASAGNSASNEDLGGSQFKESNVYVTGQQTEGLGLWIAAPGRDIPGSFYNLPQGGQVAYTQATHGPFASIYHPAQPVTTGPIHPLLHQPQTMAGGVDMVGPTSSPYPQQQPQPTQINWPNNY
uniref:GBF-interacting protein 1-like isoform X2 n=1 Tax=Erigeron canadensis TaxID=72917 RepID=UPI001CB95910|nr:GBF-interacting protein 1-like isoform X2 [Erigeron canadensis]